jgi:hypothetical protein
MATASLLTVGAKVGGGSTGGGPVGGLLNAVVQQAAEGMV